MKKVFFFILILSVQFSFAQRKQLSEKDVIKKTHIDFSKEYISFILSGTIEIDGHQFVNDTCKCPIVYSADLNGISIMNKCTKEGYDIRKCGADGCKIIHLKIKNELNLIYTPKPFQYELEPDIINIPNNPNIEYFTND